MASGPQSKDGPNLPFEAAQPRYLGLKPRATVDRRRERQKVRLAALALTLLIGCDDERAPLVPAFDAGPDARLPSDSGVNDARPSRRDDGVPTLPPADETVMLPFEGPVVERELVVRATGGRLDVHFSIDTTGSFDGEIDEVQRVLEDRIVPALAERSEDVAFGVSRFEDFPGSPFGAPTDLPFRLIAPVTNDISRVAGAVASLDQPLGMGGDASEAGAEALYQIATGDGYVAGNGVAIVPAFDGRGRGGVGFRDGALRAVVHVTDAPPHDPLDYGDDFAGTHSLTDAIEALQELDVHTLGVASGDAARAHLERVAIATGAVAAPIDGVCHTGKNGAAREPNGDVCPLVFDVDESGVGLGEVIVTALEDLLATVTFDRVHGDVDEDRLRFVRSIEATRATGGEATREDSDADGIDDTFRDVGASVELTFTVRLRNVTIRTTDYDQAFRVHVVIRGDDRIVAERTIRVIVPAGAGSD